MLCPYPFGALVRRAFVEYEREKSVFGLPARRWFAGLPSLDVSVAVHGARVATPFGPAAGPHTQLAQNIVLSWLAGGRAIELKTVQVRDDLKIPRPCIDMRTSGFNVEWSQELRLAQSLEEYVKASMLVQILAAHGVLPPAAGGRDFIFEMSIGYDLAGIQGEQMTAFLGGMLDAGAIVDRLRRQIPAEWARYRDLDFAATVSRSVTLSTFHGCPPSEIQSIVSHLQRTFGLHCTVKFNPTLLGAGRVRGILADGGFGSVVVPGEAFERDLRWEDAVALTERCGAEASALGVGFGAKFSNTLVVENRGDFLPPSERFCYLSGRPLHLLAMNLVRDFRAVFGDRYPIAFSAGIDRSNFADAVALGLAPVTVCTDLLREGGYARAAGYFETLQKAMVDAGAPTIEALCWSRGISPDAAPYRADPATHTESDRRVDWAGRTSEYLASARARREFKAAVVTTPRKVASSLAYFDCLACDKCVPVCPNHAIFAFSMETGTLAGSLIEDGKVLLRLTPEGGRRAGRRHQIGIFADFCNECGNCDVFCPEHGGPYRTKPRFFGSRESFAASGLDGFWVSRRGPHLVVCGRIAGVEYEMDEAREEAAARPLHTMMRTLGRAVLDTQQINYVNTLAEPDDQA